MEGGNEVRVENVVTLPAEASKYLENMESSPPRWIAAVSAAEEFPLAKYTKKYFSLPLLN